MNQQKLLLSASTTMVIAAALLLVPLTAMTTTTTVYAQTQDPHPPATDPKSQGSNVGSCNASHNEPGSGTQGAPNSNCREAIATQAGRDDNNPEGCYELVFPTPRHEPNTLPDDQQNGNAFFWCGAPPN